MKILIKFQIVILLLIIKEGAPKMPCLNASSVFFFKSSPILYVILFWSGNNPSIAVLISFFLIQFFAVGFIFGNYRSLAMEPLGHIAGISAAINGFVSTVMAVPIANYIGSFVHTSVLPLFIGFSVFGVFSLITFSLLKYSNSRKLI